VNRILLLPLGNTDRDLIQGLCFPLKKTFKAPVEILEESIELEDFYDEVRSQYNSTAILLHLKRAHPGPVSSDVHAPPTSTKLLAVLGYDLFIPILTYVFGEAELGGQAAVVSYYRLKNERYGLPSDSALLSDRLQKEAHHELGHAYGLVHCSNQDCVMHTSTYVEDIDLKSATFCRSCEEELIKKNQ
jgi:archaemetzincin